MEKRKINKVIVRCPICGKIHVVSKEKTTWRCHCKLLGETGRTRKHSVQETKLEDQTSLVLECGVTATPDQGIQMAYCDELKQVTINGYQVIPAGAFQDCTSLCTVKFCKDVEIIDARAFAGCSALEKIVLPEGLKYIGAGAFEGSGLKSVVFPNSITEIESRAFADCPGLEEIVLANGLVRIGPSAFRGTGLKSIILPDSVTSVGKNAFANCRNLKKAVFPAGMTAIKEGVFQNSGLEEIDWKDNIRLIDSRAFANCSFLEEIVLPEKLEHISENAFQKSGLKRIMWSDSVWDVHADAFNGCTQLEKIRISPQASIYIPFAEFPQCPFLDSYLAQHTREDGIVENRTCLRDGILRGKKGTRLVYCHTHPKAESIREIFAYLPQITELCFEPGTQSIDEFMFRGCYHLKQITLPDGLKRIGEGAFANCTDLEEIVIPESVVEISPFAFGKCTSLRTVEISESLLKKLDHSVFALTPFAKKIGVKPWRDILIVGLGTSASNLVSWIKKDLVFRQDTLVLDTAFCEDQVTSNFIPLGEAVCHGNSAKGDPALGKAAIQEKQEEICRKLQRHDFVIVVARLGGGTGSGGAPVLAQWLQTLNIPHLFITSIPQSLRYESNRRILQARRSILDMKDMGTTLLVTSNEWISRYSGFDGYIYHNFAAEDRMMYRIVQDVTNHIDFIELNISNFCHVDPMGKNNTLAYVCHGPFYDNENVEEIVGEIIRFLPRISAQDLIAYFLVPYDISPKKVDYAETMIRRTLSAKTNFIWNIVPEEKRDKPCVLFITTDDAREELSLDPDTITLSGGYPTLAGDEYLWLW